MSSQRSSRPTDIKSLRNLATLDLHGVRNVHSFDAASTFLHHDDKENCCINAFDLEYFQKNVEIKIRNITPHDNPCKNGQAPDQGGGYNNSKIEFDIIGIDAALANSLRRILLSEIPTVAIESVCVYQNTGVLQDEYLAHRLGLVPLNIDPIDVDWLREGEEEIGGHKMVQQVHFKLSVNCLNDKDRTVYARDLIWDPQSSHEKEFFEKRNYRPAPIHPDIILTRIAKGQQIILTCTAIKGVGKDHAKWSPVGTAFYRLKPEITLVKDFEGKEAEKLKESCAMGCFDIEEVSTPLKNKSKSSDKSESPTTTTIKKAYVTKDAEEKCTSCRECLEAFPPKKPGSDDSTNAINSASDPNIDSLLLQKRKDWFMFTVESVGQIKAEDLLEYALQQLIKKTATASDVLRNNVVSSDLQTKIEREYVHKMEEYNGDMVVE